MAFSKRQVLKMRHRALCKKEYKKPFVSGAAMSESEQKTRDSRANLRLFALVGGGTVRFCEYNGPAAITSILLFFYAHIGKTIKRTHQGFANLMGLLTETSQIKRTND